jgi:hypothetical protein
MSRSDPRISLNKLAEYLDASPARRRKIVRDQKEPKPFIVARYTEAEKAIVDSICAGTLRPATTAMKALETNAPTTEFAAETAELCWEALDAFVDLWEDGLLDLDGMTATRGNNEVPKLDMSGVAVSVRPDILLSRVERGEPVGGAIKLCLSKTNPMEDRPGEYAATILRKFLESTQDEVRVDDRLVIVVDVFSKRVFGPPKSYKRRLLDAEAACEEIALRWRNA